MSRGGWLGVAAFVAGLSSACTRDVALLQTEAHVRLAYDGVVSIRVLDAADGAHVVSCSEVGSFRPVHRYVPSSGFSSLASYAAKELAARPSELIRLPLEVPANPWGAGLVYVQALSEEGLPVLEGCVCARFDPDGLSEDVDANFEVLRRCRRFDEGPFDVGLEPLVPEGFELTACGAEAFVGLTGEHQLRPGICLEPRPCGGTGGSEPCYECSSESCEELGDLSFATVRITSEPPGRVAVGAQVTDRRGMVVPRSNIDSCDGELSLSAEIPGRPESRIEVPIECTPRVELQLVATQVISDSDPLLATVRADDRDGIAVAFDADGATEVELFRLGDRLEATSSADFPGEKPLSMRGEKNQGSSLALLTRGPTENAILRAFRATLGVESLTVVSTASGSCTRVCAESCGDRGMCPKSVTSATLFGADVDLDGRADLAFATPDGALSVYRSDAESEGVLHRCECGELLPLRAVAFDYREREGPTILFGSKDGLFVQGSTSRLAGPRCSLTTRACESGLECVQRCDDPFGTCFTPCVVGAADCPGRQVCIPSAPGSSSGLCTRQTLGCDVPTKILDRGPVQGLALGRFDSGTEDDLAVLLESPNGPELSVLFGRLDALQDGHRLSLYEMLADGSTPVAMAVAEVNADGFDDLVVLAHDRDQKARLDLWIGRGRGSMAPIVGAPIRCDSVRADLAMGDFDADGRDDVVVVCGASESSKLSIFAPRATDGQRGVNFAAPIVLTGAQGSRPVALALGQVTGDLSLDLVALSCESADAKGCGLGAAARPPLGRTRLTVFDDLLASPRGEPLGVELGWAGSGLWVGPLSERDHDDVVVVNARSADCATPACERSEIRVINAGGDPSGWSVDRLSVDNAVGLAAFRSDVLGSSSLVTLGQGRSVNDRPCSTRDMCLPHDVCPRLEECGCPPEELCQCPRGECDIGVCVPQTRALSVIDPRPLMVERFSCEEPLLECSRGAQPRSTCGCAGDPDAPCELDSCGCEVPIRARVGAFGQAAVAYDVAPMASDQGDDLVVATDRGIAMFRQGGQGVSFDRTLSVGSVRDVELGYLDSDSSYDLAWIDTSPCPVGGPLEAVCPLGKSRSQARGCLGVLSFDERGDWTGATSCVRRQLEFEPTAICLGDFDGNGVTDVAVTSASTSKIDVFLSSLESRSGPRLSAPVRVAIPAWLVGGPLLCRDLNGDRRTDLVTASRGGEVIVFSSKP
ncbi:MAG: VCBS repeat-containing protein [Deltaproteobacteria bacterium]|nr:VCBS repeat-containing protein [Deltaproteobacteria bacterium]